MSSPPRPLETQAARTALAWQRTGLGVLLVAGLLARGAAVHGELLLVVPAAVVAGAGLVVLGLLGPHRQRTGEVAARTGGDARAPGTAALATALVVLTALCALATDLLLRA
jgi:putative membrane protein